MRVYIIFAVQRTAERTSEYFTSAYVPRERDLNLGHSTRVRTPEVYRTVVVSLLVSIEDFAYSKWSWKGSRGHNIFRIESYP